MQAIEHEQWRKCEQNILAAVQRSVRDVRCVQPLSELPYQPGVRPRTGSTTSDRPATVGASIARQREVTKHHGLCAASKASYFPCINESSITREFREHKATHSSSVVMPLSARKPASQYSKRSARRARGCATARGRIQSDESSPRQNEYKTILSVVTSLDKQGMATMFQAFQEFETLNECEFVAEMLGALATHAASEDQRVEITSQVSGLFRQADLSARGYLTWQDFSAWVSQASDVVSALEDTAINKYQADDTPSPINFAAEIEGLIYLPEIDQVVIHDTKTKGFQSYDVPTGRIRSATGSDTSSRGRLVDAVYSNRGRYIITASTSPVLSFYDADQLQVRQQIPTDSLQTALAIDNCSAPQVYSACANGKVHVWDLESLKRRHTFSYTTESGGSAAMVSDLKVLPATSLLACGSMDGNIYMLDVAVGRVSKTLRGHTKGVSMLQYCADNKYLVSGGIDHKLQVWNPQLEQQVGSLPGHRSQLVGLYVRPNSPEILTADASGVVKIWDLRKFAAVQTIVKELYVKNHAVPASRAMTAMCYIESQQRIAIAHSTVYFLDPVHGNDGERREASARQATIVKQQQHELPSFARQLERPQNREQAEEEEEHQPLEVIFHPPTQCFMAITPWRIVCWDASTGSRVRSTPITLGPEATCVAVMDDLYSCFVGCENGSIARLVLPNAAVVVHKRVHTSGEITALRLLPPLRRLVSSGSDGNMVVSSWDTLEPIQRLDHWRGVHSVRSIRGFDGHRISGECYSLPLHLRPYFIGNEGERLKAAFAEADPHGSGTIALSLLPQVLERVFPTAAANANPATPSPRCSEEKKLTFAMFAETVKESLTDGMVASKGPALASIASFDVHAQREILVSTSASDSGVCLWNLRNATAIGEVSIDEVQTPVAPEASDPLQLPPPKKRSIAFVVFLHPLPYFVCIEENSPRCTLWCSVAIPPWLPKPYQCVLTYTLTNAAPDLRTRASTMDLKSRATFVTESTLTAAATTPKPLVIRAVCWFLSERDGKKLLCVGDDLGQIHVLDCRGVLRRIDDLRKQTSNSACLSTTELLDERGRGSSSTAQSPTGSTRVLLPPTLLQKLHRWSAHQPYGIGIRSVRVLDIETLIQPHANKRVVVVTVSDNGATQLWSVDGQRLGRLRVTGGETDSFLGRCQWKLDVDVDELKQRNHESAMSLLKQIEHRSSVSMNQHEEEGSIGTEIRGNQHNHLLRRPTCGRGTSLLHHKSSPRSVRRVGQLQQRNGASTTEDALVAWRQSIPAKPRRPPSPPLGDRVDEDKERDRHGPIGYTRTT